MCRAGLATAAAESAVNDMRHESDEFHEFHESGLSLRQEQYSGDSSRSSKFVSKQFKAVMAWMPVRRLDGV